MMSDNNITPLSVGDDDAPFSSPTPGSDDDISQVPATDDDIDLQEYYDEGLAETAELDVAPSTDPLPEGFHIENPRGEY